MGEFVKRALTIVGAMVLLISPSLVAGATGDQYFTAYAVPTAYASPSDMVVGADGAMWFTERLARGIGRVTTSGVITEFPTPSDGYEENFPVAIASGADGAVWFTNVLGRNVSRMATNGAVTEYALPYGSLTWSDVVTGPDGAVWFSNWFTGTHYNIGRISTDGTITAFPTTQAYSDIGKMTVGPDGALWMTRSSSRGSYISRMTTTGAFSEYALPVGTNPKGITAGADGAVWFTEYGTNAIGTITTEGTITHYPLARVGATPVDILSRPDGTLWFVEQSPNMLVSMGTDGVLKTEYAVPYSASLQTLVNGPNGVLWFTDSGANLVGWFDVPAPQATMLAVTPPSGVGSVGQTATLQATARNSLGNPVAAVTVRFAVTGSVTTTGACTTDTSGTCTFAYTGPQLPGADAIDAYVDTNANNVQDQTEPSTTATQAWLLPTTTEGQVTGGGHIVGDSTQGDIAFGFMAKSDSKGVKGNCSVVDPAANVSLHCTDATILVVNGDVATIFGSATVNGESTMYRIDVTDVATSGIGGDTFAISTQSGYRASGTLTGGNIQIHKD